MVTHITWTKRPQVVSKDKSVRLSPQAATHFLSSLDGYINRKGEIISPIGFNRCHQFAKGLARVRIYFGRGIFDGLINKEGKAVLVLSNSIGK